MYKSISSWCFYPITVKKFDGRTIAGDAKVAAEIEIACYVEGSAVVIADRQGGEYVSSTQLYIDSAVELSEDDKIVLDGKTYDIRKLAKFYDGQQRALSLQVVYL